MNYNKVIMAGNITRDVQLSYLPSQTPVVEFGLASNKKYKGKDGNMVDDTCFVDCKAFGATAKNIAKFFSKGKGILVEGELCYESWKAQDGTKRNKLQIKVYSFTFVDGPSGGPSGETARSSKSEHEDAKPDGPPSSGPLDDDVPF